LARRGAGCTAAGTWRAGAAMGFWSLWGVRTNRLRFAASALSLGRSRRCCCGTREGRRRVGVGGGGGGGGFGVLGLLFFWVGGGRGWRRGGGGRTGGW